MAILTDTVEGVVDRVTWFHYDLADDVLYLRRAADRAAATISEETPDGLLLLRREDNDRAVGVTVVNWWKRFGQGDLPDSLTALQEAIEPWAKRIDSSA